jgi:endonuclease YncB( thermonuclease family)
MSFVRRTFVLLAFLVVACEPSAPASTGASFDARVVGVGDGDTLRIRRLTGGSEERVRLLGVDAPELHQSFGGRSKQHLSSLVFGKNVRVEPQKIDQYGRIVGKVFVGSTDVGLAQIEAGMAWHYAYYAREQAVGDRSRYAAAQVAARSSRLGLWADGDAVEPHRFRLAHPRQ